MPAPRLSGIVVLLLSLLVAACGGSSSSSTLPALVAVEAPAHQPGEGYVVGGVHARPHDELMVVGDNGLDQTDVGVLCFDLTGIDNVDSAVLRFYFAYEVGDAWSLGDMRLDHIDGGGTLDLADFDGGTLIADVFALGQQDEYVLDVTDLVAADIAAGRTHSTFRLRFEVPTNGNGSSDFVRFGTSQAADPLLRPTLEVTHLVP